MELGWVYGRCTLNEEKRNSEGRIGEKRDVERACKRKAPTGLGKVGTLANNAGSWSDGNGGGRRRSANDRIWVPL